MKRFFQAMVTDDRGRDVPVVRELRCPPGPLKLIRKRPPLPRLTRTIAICYWIGAVYIALKAGLISVLWLKVASSAGATAGIVAHGTGTLLLLGMWPVPRLASPSAPPATPTCEAPHHKAMASPHAPTATHSGVCPISPGAEMASTRKFRRP